MPYPEILIKPMRDELTQLGVQEARTPEQVDAAVKQAGTVMVIVNSVCGCAAGKARPGIAMALRNQTLPDRIVTVFAGADIEATDHARNYFKGYPPSSPSVGLMRDGELVFMLQRHQIEGRDAPQIASELTAAFDRYCTKTKVGS
ncbi:MAG TPA: BrxA/BrxB family bacilliredoxin [Terriglobia bacterium]|nr:BrxA/BrxB family bacilliredoxin [Terriglobia bacterium]